MQTMFRPISLLCICLHNVKQAEIIGRVLPDYVQNIDDQTLRTPVYEVCNSDSLVEKLSSLDFILIVKVMKIRWKMFTSYEEQRVLSLPIFGKFIMSKSK